MKNSLMIQTPLETELVYIQKCLSESKKLPTIKIVDYMDLMNTRKLSEKETTTCKKIWDDMTALINRIKPTIIINGKVYPPYKEK